MSSADHYVAMDRERKKGFFGFIKYHLANMFFGPKVHNYDKDERILNFKNREIDAFGYNLTPNEAAEEEIKQKRLIKASDKLLKNGWAVEIVAALIGISVAFATGYSIHNDAGNTIVEGVSLLEKEGTSVWLNIILGSLPFVMVAIVELTKIPLARVVYNAESLLKTITFSFVLAGTILITYETMLTGLERSIAGQLSQISHLYIERENVSMDKDADIGVNYKAISALNGKQERKHDALATEKNNERTLKKDINSKEFSLYTDAINEIKFEISTLGTNKDNRKNELTENSNLSIKRLESAIISLNEQRSQDIKSKGDELGSANTQADKTHTNKIKGREKIIASLKSDIISKKKEIDEDENGIPAGVSSSGATTYLKQPCYGSFQDCLYEREKPVLEAMKSELKDNQSQLSNLISNPPKSDNKAFDLARNKINKDVDKEIKSLRLEIKATTEKSNNMLTNDTEIGNINNKIINAEERLNTARADLVVAQDDRKLEDKSLKGKVQDSKDKQAKLESEIGVLTEDILELENGSSIASINILDKQIRQINREINEKASNINMYRIAYMFYEPPEFIEKTKEELAQLTDKEMDTYKEERSKANSGAILYSEVPPSFVNKVAGWWFGSLALIVSIVGTILAFGSFLLRDYHTRTRSGLVEDLKCIWRFITGEEDCRRQPDSANVSRGRAAHPNSRGVNLDENIQYIREAVFIPYLTTDPSIVNAPLQAVADKAEEQDAPNTDADTLTDEDSAASSLDDNTGK